MTVQLLGIGEAALDRFLTPSVDTFAPLRQPPGIEPPWPPPRQGALPHLRVDRATDAARAVRRLIHIKTQSLGIG